MEDMTWLSSVKALLRVWLTSLMRLARRWPPPPPLLDLVCTVLACTVLACTAACTGSMVGAVLMGLLWNGWTRQSPSMSTPIGIVLLPTVLGRRRRALPLWLRRPKLHLSAMLTASSDAMSLSSSTLFRRLRPTNAIEVPPSSPAGTLLSSGLVPCVCCLLDRRMPLLLGRALFGENKSLLDAFCDASHMGVLAGTSWEFFEFVVYVDLGLSTVGDCDSWDWVPSSSDSNEKGGILF